MKWWIIIGAVCLVGCADRIPLQFYSDYSRDVAVQECSIVCTELGRTVHLSEPGRCICSDDTSIIEGKVMESAEAFVREAVEMELVTNVDNILVCSVKQRGPGRYIGYDCKQVQSGEIVSGDGIFYKRIE